MKRDLSELLRKCQFPVMLAAISMPPALLLYALAAPQRMAFVWLLPVLYLGFALGGLLVPGKKRPLYGIAAICVLAAAGIYAAHLCGSLWLLILPVLYGALMLASLPFAGWAWHMELPPMVSYIGVAVFLTVQFLAYLFQELFPDVQERIGTGMTVSFLVFALLMLLSINRSALAGAFVGRQRASANVRQKNRTVLLLFFLIVTLLVAVPALLNALFYGFKRVLQAVSELLEMLRWPEASSVSTETTVSATGGGGSLSTMAPISDFARLMKRIFSGIAGYIFVGAILAYLFFVGKKFRKSLAKLWRKLMRMFSRLAVTSAADYEEVVTDIRKEDSEKRLRPRRRRISAAVQRKMEPDQRVRWRYEQLRYKHPDWGDSSTARENLSEKAAPVYERARYSRENISEEEANQFLSDTKRI